MMIIEMVFLVFHTSVIFGKCISFWFSLLHSFENMRMCFVGVCFWTSVFLWSIAPPRVSQTIEINESVRTISVSSNRTTVVLIDLIVRHVRVKKHTHLLGCVCVCACFDQFSVFIIDSPIRLVSPRVFKRCRRMRFVNHPRCKQMTRLQIFTWPRHHLRDFTIVGPPHRE